MSTSIDILVFEGAKPLTVQVAVTARCPDCGVAVPDVDVDRWLREHSPVCTATP